MDAVLTRAQFVRWRTAIFAIFLISGLSISTWASRVPAIRESLGIDEFQVGLMLLAAGAFSIGGLSLAPVVLARFGARKGMMAAIIIFGVGVFVIGLGADGIVSYPLVCVGLALFGLGNGAVDVMMNVEGSAIEAQSGKTILPLFHALFSVGTVIGSTLGFAAAALGVGVMPHTAVVAVLILVTGVIAIANVPVRENLDPEPATTRAGRSSWRTRLHAAMAVWREPRTYFIGLIMLGMAFAEGGALDWIALGVEREQELGGHGLAAGTGAATLAVFSVAMTVMRVCGGRLVDRFGRVAVLRVLSVSAVLGLVLFILAPAFWVVLVGAALWGAGVSLGFPIGMSAAGDDPRDAAARVSAVATIGYFAFLAGPPLLGLLASQIGVLNTLWILAGLAAISGLASEGARPLGEVGRGRRRGDRDAAAATSASDGAAPTAAVPGPHQSTPEAAASAGPPRGSARRED